MTQTLIIHVIRTNKIPFIQSWASWPLILTSVIVVAVGAGLTASLLAAALGFLTLPSLYWLPLSIIFLCSVVLTQLIKTWFHRRFDGGDEEQAFIDQEITTGYFRKVT